MATLGVKGLKGSDFDRPDIQHFNSTQLVYLKTVAERIKEIQQSTSK